MLTNHWVGDSDPVYDHSRIIIKKEIAEEIINLSLETSFSFNQMLLNIRDDCQEEEFKEIRKGIGHVLGSLLLDVMNPVFKKYPDLIPEGLKDSYT